MEETDTNTVAEYHKRTPGLFRFVDLDKIVSYLEKEIIRNEAVGDSTDNMYSAGCAYSRAAEAAEILKVIKSGQLCYHQGSE